MCFKDKSSDAELAEPTYQPTHRCVGVWFLFYLELWRVRLSVLQARRWIEIVGPEVGRAGAGALEALHRVVQPGFLGRVVVQPGERSLVLEQGALVLSRGENRPLQSWDRHHRARHLIVAGRRRRRGGGRLRSLRGRQRRGSVRMTRRRLRAQGRHRRVRGWDRCRLGMGRWKRRRCWRTRRTDRGHRGTVPAGRRTPRVRRRTTRRRAGCSLRSVHARPSCKIFR